MLVTSGAHLELWRHRGPVDVVDGAGFIIATADANRDDLGITALRKIPGKMHCHAVGAGRLFDDDLGACFQDRRQFEVAVGKKMDFDRAIAGKHTDMRCGMAFFGQLRAGAGQERCKKAPDDG